MVGALALLWVATTVALSAEKKAVVLVTLMAEKMVESLGILLATK